MQYDENAEKYGYEGEMTPMKCDELKLVENPIEWGLYYDKAEVDEAIAKLRTENAELKAKLEDAKATAQADSVDAGMRERRLKRALYKACANWAGAVDHFEDSANEKWSEMKYKCRAMADKWR